MLIPGSLYPHLNLGCLATLILLDLYLSTCWLANLFHTNAVSRHIVTAGNTVTEASRLLYLQNLPRMRIADKKL